MSKNRKALGKWGEDYAEKYLIQKEYHILQKNYRFERNEIDIVAQFENTLVFVEVKTVSTLSYGEPEDKVDPHKQQLIQKVAEGYLYEKELDEISCRFDVIAIQKNQSKIQLKHYIDAF